MNKAQSRPPPWLCFDRLRYFGPRSFDGIPFLGSDPKRLNILRCLAPQLARIGWLATAVALVACGSAVSVPLGSFGVVLRLGEITTIHQGPASIVLSRPIETVVVFDQSRMVDLAEQGSDESIPVNISVTDPRLFFRTTGGDWTLLEVALVKNLHDLTGAARRDKAAGWLRSNSVGACIDRLCE